MGIIFFGDQSSLQILNLLSTKIKPWKSSSQGFILPIIPYTLTVFPSASSAAIPQRFNTFSNSPYSHFTSKLFPVISLGCSIPISSIKVGMISARQPPSLSLYAGSAFTRMKGTGLVV